MLDILKRHKKLIRNLILIISPVRILLTGFVINNYIKFSSSTVFSKGGTVVEAVFDNISYLPYLSENSESDYFYQSLLFDSCVKYSNSGNNLEISTDICDIQTKDNQIYEININSGHNWSDGSPMTNDDIFFTYNKIIKGNMRKIPYLDIYANIIVTKAQDNKIKVSFPTNSIDNWIFFTNKILPYLYLEDSQLSLYKTIFVENPITSHCAKIGKSSDKRSLIFDLLDCNDTKLGYYQIKYFNDFDEMYSQYIENKSNFFVDIYRGNQKIPNYETENIVKNEYIGLFFNTKSSKINDRIRRSFAGLVEDQLFTGDVDPYVKKNPLIFDDFRSKGENIKNHIVSHISNPDIKINTDDLKKINISDIPKNITITGNNNKYVFQTNRTTGNFQIEIYFSGYKDYKNVRLSKLGGSGQEIKLKNNKFVLGIDKNQIKKGLNKYVLKMTREIKSNKKSTMETKSVLDIDVYFLESEQTKADLMNDEKKIKIIYYDDIYNNHIISGLTHILDQNNISEYFNIQKYDDFDDFEKNLCSGNYDMVLRSIDFGSKKSIGNFLLIDNNSLINPSFYKNESLVANINSYTNGMNKNGRIKDDINSVYGNIMPFIILGNKIEKIQLNDRLKYTIGDKNIYKFYQAIYEQTNIKKKLSLNVNSIFNIKNFLNFISKQQ